MPDVHEEERDQSGLYSSNGQRNRGIERAKVQRSREHGQPGAHEQSDEYGEVTWKRRRFCVSSHAKSYLCRSFLMSIDQIEQRKKINPDDVDEVPVEAADFNRRVVLGGESSFPCHQ